MDPRLQSEIYPEIDKRHHAATEEELYDDRGVGDWVVSGPIYPANGRGRTFLTPRHALEWAQEKYGADRVRLLPESMHSVRWAIRVRGRR